MNLSRTYTNRTFQTLPMQKGKNMEDNEHKVEFFINIKGGKSIGAA